MRAIGIALLILAAWAVCGPQLRAASSCHVVSSKPACPSQAHAHRPAHSSCSDSHGCRKSRRIARDRFDDWYLHRPSTPEERAETSDLNRQYLESHNAIAGPAPAYSHDEAQYQRDLRQYWAARQAHDRQMREYFDSFQPPPAGPEPYPRDGWRPPVAYDTAGVAPMPDEAERFDPWHGYNFRDGLGNGY
jgi:hypothetical protein